MNEIKKTAGYERGNQWRHTKSEKQSEINNSISQLKNLNWKQGEQNGESWK
jgi:hypothetical protein